MEVALGAMAVKGRYLQYLGTKRAGEVDNEEEEDCIICFGTSDDKNAALLECGHMLCLVRIFKSRMPSSRPDETTSVVLQAHEREKCQQLPSL